MKKVFFCLLASIVLFSCGKDEESYTETTTTTTTTSDTWVKLIVMDMEGTIRPGLTIMMFGTPVTDSTLLPPIIKQVLSDNDGLAYFDLNSEVTSTTEVTYYFEAFEPIQNGFSWESITHPSYEIKKGTMITSSIIVN